MQRGGERLACLLFPFSSDVYSVSVCSVFVLYLRVFFTFLPPLPRRIATLQNMDLSSEKPSLRQTTDRVARRMILHSLNLTPKSNSPQKVSARTSPSNGPDMKPQRRTKQSPAPKPVQRTSSTNSTKTTLASDRHPKNNGERQKNDLQCKRQASKKPQPPQSKKDLEKSWRRKPSPPATSP